MLHFIYGRKEGSFNKPRHKLNKQAGCYYTDLLGT
jgi:hypothetical protein